MTIKNEVYQTSKNNKSNQIHQIFLQDFVWQQLMKKLKNERRMFGKECKIFGCKQSLHRPIFLLFCLFVQ